MTVPGGSRRENRNGVLGREPQGAEPSLDISHEFTDAAGKGEVRRNGKRGGGLVHGGEESKRDTPSGVWLSAEDGTVLVPPVAAAAEGLQRRSAPAPDSVEEADEMTLDAASRLMPLLPRELIAEYLQLGPFRDGGDAS